MTIDILPNVSFISLIWDVNSAISARFRTEKLRNIPKKKPKKGGDKSAVAILRDIRQLSGVFQDTEPPESLSILRKSPKFLGSIRRVRFTRARVRHANIRENKGPSLGKIQVKVPHQRSPCALKFEGRSQEETERQERCARGDVPKISISSKRRRELHSIRLLKSGLCRPHPQ